MGITIDTVPIQGTSSDAIDGDEKFLAVDGNGRPVTVGVNQILNKVDDRIDDVIDEQFSEIVNEKADAAAPQATTYTKTEVDDMWAWEEL